MTDNKNELMPCNGTPESVALCKILKALNIRDLNVNRQGLFEGYIRDAMRHTDTNTIVIERSELEMVRNMLSYYSVDNCDETKIPYGVAQHLELIQEHMNGILKGRTE